MQMLHFWWKLILFVHVSPPPWESFVNELQLRASQSDTCVKPKPNCFAPPKWKQIQNTSNPGPFLDCLLHNGTDLSKPHPSHSAVSTITITIWGID